MEQFRKVVFLLLIFLISSQVGIHFWPKFSYVDGVRIDYLSPTLYLLDIFIITFISLSLVSVFKKKILLFKDNGIAALIAIFVLVLIHNIFFAKSQGAHLYGIVRVIEFILLGFLVAKTFSKKDIPGFIYALCLSGIVSSVLAIWQFIKQASVGGLWYYFGERTFNLNTIGISTVNLDQQVLRSYGAFPHPNVLAFFLLTVIVFSTQVFKNTKNNKVRIFIFFSILISSIALLLTFSRIVIVLAVSFIFYELYAKGKRNVNGLIVILAVLLAIYLFVPQVLNSEFLLRGLNFREELFLQSFEIFKTSPYFGIGINNFFMNQSPLIKSISPIIFQPVHNIFVLSLLSLGLFGWWIFPASFVSAIRSLIKKIHTKDLLTRDFYRAVLFMVFSIIVVGMFDHFFLTVEQGLIMLALILGLSFSKVKD